MPVPLSIVFAVPDFEPAVGGTTRQTGLQARALAARGHRVVVVARRTRRAWPRYEVLDGLEVHRIGPPGRGQRADHLAVLSLGLWLFRRRRTFDILQTVMWSDATLSAAAAGVLRRVSVLWAIRGEAADAFSPGGALPRRLKSRIRIRALRRCRHIVLTGTMHSELLELGLASNVIPVPVDPSRFRVPTDKERIDARADLGIEQDALAIISIGHLQRRKRIDRLIAAFAPVAQQHATNRLLLVGGPRGADDDVEEQLRAQVNSLGLSKSVIFFGAIEAPERHLWASDVFVLASDREGMPNSILEAMSCGLPCIAPASAGGTELLDEDSGIVPPTGEPEDLLPALRRLIDQPRLRTQLGHVARSRAQRYHIDQVILDYERVYSQIAGRARGVSIQS